MSRPTYRQAKDAIQYHSVQLRSWNETLTELTPEEDQDAEIDFFVKRRNGKLTRFRMRYQRVCNNYGWVHTDEYGTGDDRSRTWEQVWRWLHGEQYPGAGGEWLQPDTFTFIRTTREVVA